MREQPEAVRIEYERQFLALVRPLQQAAFLARLRNYVLHYVVAPWRFRGTFGDTTQATVLLDVSTLLEFDWNKDARGFIESCGKSVVLSPLLSPYREATELLQSRLYERCWAEGASAIEESNQLIARRNLILSSGVTDGRDWFDRVANIQENLTRERRGEPQIDFPEG